MPVVRVGVPTRASSPSPPSFPERLRVAHCPAASVEPGTSFVVATDTAGDNRWSRGERVIPARAANRRPDRPRNPVPCPPCRPGPASPSAIGDPLKGRWRIARASWNQGVTTDRLTLSLTRMSGGNKNGTSIEMVFMSPGKAASTYGVTRPARRSGHRAHVRWAHQCGHHDGRRPRACRRSRPSTSARTQAGVTHAVIGISGSGCARLNAPDWRSGSDSITSADLLLDVRR